MKRIFENEPGQIRFTEDFKQQTRGSLRPGQPIDLEFADSRIPDEPTGAASLEACVQFNKGAVVATPLRLRQGWRTINPALTEPGEGNLWVGRFTPPAGTTEMCIWFVKTGPSGRKYYDSRFGKNYWFRFVELDLDILSATVDAKGFHLDIETSGEVTSVEARYNILNAGAVAGVLPLSVKSDKSKDKKLWVGSAPLNPKAVVSFAVVYSANGHSYTDDNQRRGYLAPDPTLILGKTRVAASGSPKTQTKNKGKDIPDIRFLKGSEGMEPGSPAGSPTA